MGSADCTDATPHAATVCHSRSTTTAHNVQSVWILATALAMHQVGHLQKDSWSEVFDSFLTKIVHIYNMAFCASEQLHHSGLLLSLWQPILGCGGH